MKKWNNLFYDVERYHCSLSFNSLIRLKNIHNQKINSKKKPLNRDGNFIRFYEWLKASARAHAHTNNHIEMWQIREKCINFEMETFQKCWKSNVKVQCERSVSILRHIFQFWLHTAVLLIFYSLLYHRISDKKFITVIHSFNLWFHWPEPWSFDAFWAFSKIIKYGSVGQIYDNFYILRLICVFLRNRIKPNFNYSTRLVSKLSPTFDLKFSLRDWYENNTTHTHIYIFWCTKTVVNGR